MSEQKSRTPYQIYQSIIQNLAVDVDRINLMRQDQELILDNWTIHLAIDPHDIGRFCFPFNPYDILRNLRPLKVAEISRLQNGRHEAIYNLSKRPILLRAYDKEWDGTLEWARWSNQIVKDDAVLDKYLEALQLSPRSEQDEAKEILEELTDTDIGSIIAIVTGILHIGVKRLNEIFNRRLMRGRLDGLNEPPKIEERHEIVDRISKVFRRYFENNEWHVDDPQFTRQIKQFKKGIDDRIRPDARAVDQLIYLNQVYNPRKQLILYFSSSAKSLQLNKDAAELKDLLPSINGEAYPLVRTPEDLFAYMVYKGDSADHRERATHARDWLKKLSVLLKDIESTRDRFIHINQICQHCNVDVQASLCEYGIKCEGIREYGEAIESNQYRNVNMSLQLRLAEALEKTQSQQTRERYKNILNALSEIVAEKSPKPEERRMNFLMNVSITKASFVSAILGPGKRGEDIKVSCYLNNFPTSLQITTVVLKQIVNQVVELLRDWDHDKFEEYVGAYLKFDAQLSEDAESELARCFLYLIMNKPAEARKIAEFFLAADRPLGESLRREFRYLLCFILWREGKHEEAIRLASEGCQPHDADGRFFHCRSVITLDLMTLQKKQGKQQTYIYQDVVDDTLSAVERFTREDSSPLSAVCYNNLAYYLSDPEFKMVNVALAEEYFGELVKRIPETEWGTVYPEYFHTKGCVYYSKFILSPSEENQKYLDEALASATTAHELYPIKEEHGDLLKRIDNALKIRFS